MGDDVELRRVTSERDLAVERFVLMCRAMNQAMWDWDIRTNVAWYTDAIYEVYGIARGITPSFERWTTYVHPDDRERVIGGFRKIFETGQPRWSDEYRFVRPDNGAVLEVADRGFVMLENGHPVRMVGVVMDVTQRRATERQLRHAQKMQAVGQLSGGIAHDFNNMLQAAKLELDLLRATPTASPQVLGHAKEIALALERAARLTRQLRMFSRLEAMRPEPLDLNTKIADLATMLRRLLGDTIVLHLDLASGAVSTEADSSMLDQVLINLTVNARDAMVHGGKLSIATSRCGALARPEHAPGRYVCLEVSDTGIGIPADVQARIFEPFFTTKPSGTGLGLATVHGIVEQHRGWTEHVSEVGRGTTFRVYLPELDRAVAHAGDAPQPAGPRGKETILLVEDDGSVRRALSSLLKSHGYEVVVADCGAAALAAWDTAGGKIDLVVTDLVMAGMNGRELAATLSARRPSLKIIIVSGHTRDLEPSLAASYELLHKPFEGETLLATVRACLDRVTA
jgi:PAS domain S-box-containing protein